MIGGSALVSRDSAPAFGNLQLRKDEVEPWLRRPADEVHEQGASRKALVSSGSPLGLSCDFQPYQAARA